MSPGETGGTGEVHDPGEVGGDEPTPAPEERPSSGPDELVALRARLEQREARLLEERQRRIRALAWAVLAAFVVLLVVVWATLLR